MGTGIIETYTYRMGMPALISLPILMLSAALLLSIVGNIVLLVLLLKKSKTTSLPTR